MTIKKGQPWGYEVPAPHDAVRSVNDAEVAARIAAGDETPVIVTGGDLHRTVGGNRGGGAATLRLPIDALRVTADGTEHVAVAHVIARRPGRFGWWRGPILAAMNAEYFGVWDVAPRAHPNDGWADVVEVAATMTARQRWQARRRLTSGTHLPHPDLTSRRTRHLRLDFDEPLGVWIDGVRRGTARTLDVEVVADAAAVYV